MSTAEHYRGLERMYLSGPINAFYAPEISIAEGQAEISIALRPELFHAAGAVHGAVCFKLLDDAAFFAANSLIEDVFLLTVSFTVYFLRPASQGRVRACGRLVHRSQRLLIAEAELTDEAGRAIARGSGTFVRSNISLVSVPGYSRPVSSVAAE